MKFLNITDIEGNLVEENTNGRTWQANGDYGAITKQVIFRGKKVSYNVATFVNIMFVRGMGKVNNTHNVWSNDIIQLKEGDVCEIENIGETNLVYLIFA